MGRRSKSIAKSEDEEKLINGNHKSRHKSSFVFYDSDDDEANEDLSLKIVEKAMSGASHTDAGGEDIITTELVESVIVEKDSKKAKKEKKEKKRKKKKAKSTEIEIKMVTLNDEEEVAKDAEVVKSGGSDDGDKSNSNNVVLRRLLRGPRYFDPPDKSWGACFNCGEDGHSAVNCTSARRKKPCFICGSLEHEVKQCQKGKDCFICKGGGHRAKDCPKKFKRCSQAELCLKCGASSHGILSCNNEYSRDDLKEIQCYVCKKFGHLCCVDYFDALLSEASCYKCGQSGHNGEECRGSKGESSASGTPSCFKCREGGHFARECTNSSTELRGSQGEIFAPGTPTSCYKCGEEGHFARECTNSSKARRGSQVETYGTGTPASCFKCGEEGHFARECTNSSMVKNRFRDFSTPPRTHTRDSKANRGFKSAPQDFGNANKKRLQFDNGSPNWSSKPKRRGGWITDDPGDFPLPNGWRSPATPNKKHKAYGSTSGSQGSSSHSSDRWGKYSSGASNSQGYSNGYQHRFSASRFGNSFSYENRRNYSQW